MKIITTSGQSGKWRAQTRDQGGRRVSGGVVMDDLERLTAELNAAIARRLRQIARDVEDYRRIIIRAMMPEGK